MIITTTQQDGVIFYHFEKGNFSYSCSLRDFDNCWEIWTTDKRLAAPHNTTVKAKFESEMKARVWQDFFSFINAAAIAA